ncbi:MAG: hypothetical protein QM594_18660 [Niabella sp.]
MATKETLSVRKTPFYLFLILLGFLLFYVFDYVRDRGKPGTSNDTVPTKASRIPADTAKLYMENYLKDQASLEPEYRMVTKKDEQLRGFWLSKAALDSIDKSVKRAGAKTDVVGYSIFFGKPNGNDKRRIYNLVVRGSIKNSVNTEKRAMSSNKGDVIDEGDYFDSIDPCPSRCGEGSPTDIVQ